MTTEQSLEIARTVANELLFGAYVEPDNNDCEQCDASVPFLPVLLAAELERTPIDVFVLRIARGEVHARISSSGRLTICLCSMFAGNEC